VRVYGWVGVCVCVCECACVCVCVCVCKHLLVVPAYAVAPCQLVRADLALLCRLAVAIAARSHSFLS
jgi:hypothetical protein